VRSFPLKSATIPAGSAGAFGLGASVFSAAIASEAPRKRWAAQIDALAMWWLLRRCPAGIEAPFYVRSAFPAQGKSSAGRSADAVGAATEVAGGPQRIGVRPAGRRRGAGTGG